MSQEDPAWEDLEVLLAAVSLGSLSAAAESLGLGQSTASRRIARLERRLGTRLLDRTPEGTRATAFAERLMPHAELIGGHMNDIARLCAGEEHKVRGRVRVAVPDGLASHWLIPRMGSLYAAHPELEVDFVIGTAIVDLVRREADLALRFVAPTHADLLVRKVARMKLQAYALPELADAHPNELRFIELADPSGMFMETQWIRRHAPRARSMRVDGWHAMLAAACAGLGAAILSPLVAEDLGLVPLSRVPKVGVRELLMVYHPALREVPRVAAVREWLLAHAPPR